MAYNVDNIILLNLTLAASGLGYADFSTALAFGHLAECDDPYFLEDTYRDYSTLAEVAVDFPVGTEIYKIATRWFANIPKPPQLSVWMMASGDTPAEAAVKADDEVWRFWWFFENADLTETNAVALSPVCDSTSHYAVITITDANAIDPSSSADLASVLQALGNRFISVGYKDPASVTLDSSQAYAMCQVASAFHKFRPEGLRTAITAEYQVLPGVTGDDLSTTAYNALKAKDAFFFTQIELQGSTDNSRVINSKSMSSYGEFMDDVVNLAALKNRMQVAGYNYIANAGNKRALDTKGYAGLLSTLEDVCKQFYDNGVLGESTYVDILTGEEKTAKYGYIIYSNPEDVLSLTDTQRRARVFPETSITVILARAGHTATININAE